MTLTTQQGFCMSVLRDLDPITVWAIYINYFSKGMSDYAKTFSGCIGTLNKQHYSTSEVSVCARKALVMLGLVKDEVIDNEIEAIDVNKTDDGGRFDCFRNQIKVNEFNLAELQKKIAINRDERTPISDKIIELRRERNVSSSQKDWAILDEKIKELEDLAISRCSSNKAALKAKKSSLEKIIERLYKKLQNTSENSKVYKLIEQDINDKHNKVRQINDAYFVLQDRV